MDRKYNGYLPKELQIPGLWDIIQNYSEIPNIEHKYKLAMNRLDFTEAAILSLQDPQGKLDIYEVMQEEKKNLDTAPYLSITWDKVLPTAIYTDNKEIINYAEKQTIYDYNLAMIAAVIKKNNVLAQRYIDYGAHDWDMGLQIAAQHGDISAINFFKSKGANIPDYGLMGAAEGGHLNLVKQFISEGAVNLRTAFLKAVKGGQYNVMKYINEEYPMFNNEYGDTEKDIGIYAGYNDKKDIIKLYLENSKNKYAFEYLAYGYAKKGDMKKMEYFSEISEEDIKTRCMILLIASGAQKPMEIKEKTGESILEEMLYDLEINFEAIHFYYINIKYPEDFFIFCNSAACTLDNLNLIKFLKHVYSGYYEENKNNIYQSALGSNARTILNYLNLNMKPDLNSFDLLIPAVQRNNLRLVQNYPEILNNDETKEFARENDVTSFIKIMTDNHYENLYIIGLGMSTSEYYVKNNLVEYDPTQNYSFPLIYCFCKYGKINIQTAMKKTEKIWQRKLLMKFLEL